MPAKPAWYSNLDGIIQQLAALPRPFVDRATVESILGVGRRRAQQILAPCITDRVGASGLADRDLLVDRLRQLAERPETYYEVRRRRGVAATLQRLHDDYVSRPKLIVEAPAAVIHQELEHLPAGVRLEPGRITVDFDHPHEALEKLLALAMAISNDFDSFEGSTRRTPE